jgi:histidinol-phosphate aminotransferase
MSKTGRFAALAAGPILGLTPYQPGKPLSELEREYGVRDSIKLASNENPLGPSPLALAALQKEFGSIAVYPDGGAFTLRAAIARHLGCHSGQITLGNGSNDVLVLIAETFLGPAASGVYSAFGFLVYPLAIQATGATVRVAAAHGPDAAMPLGHDLAAMRACVDDTTRVVFIANPNNPTGGWLQQDELEQFLSALPPTCIAVVDEAYSEYVTAPGYPDCTRWLDRYPNLVVTRTFSKAYGLAGLRIGYAVSHPEVAELLNRVRQPFNVNALAQSAALAALADSAHLEQSRLVNAQGRRQLEAGLASLGWRVLPSAGNFVLCDTGSPAQPIYEGLLRAGVVVRPVANYGLPNHLRITVGTPAQLERALGALQNVVA